MTKRKVQTFRLIPLKNSGNKGHRERDRETERQRDRETERQRDKIRRKKIRKKEEFDDADLSLTDVDTH